MFDLTADGDDSLRACFVFPAGFTGFRGHFPERPVLPAVCNIQAVVAMLEGWSEKTVRLNEIVLAKFSAAATCGEELAFWCSLIIGDDQKAVVKATVGRNGERIAKFTLKVTLEGEAQES
jgi:3-hydroxyacyl-[acyl-carrier-protein] dehydratase